MKIVGFDPGRTTGYCVISVSRKGESDPMIVSVGTLDLDDHLTNKVWHILAVHNPSLIVIEDVISKGYLSNDKTDQIRAHDRIYTEAKNRKAQVVTLSPEVRKRLGIKAPSGLSSDHERDAYKIAVAVNILRQEGADVHGTPKPAEEEDNGGTPPPDSEVPE